MSMTYSGYVTALGAMLAMSQTITAPATAAPSTNTDFNNILPRCIEFAELTMYRDPDLDFLATRKSDTTTACVANSRNLVLPASIIVPMRLNVITPIGAASADAGTRNTVEIVQRDFMDTFFQTVAPTTTPSVPAYAAMISEDNSTGALSAILGPTPDQNYICEWYGTFRPAPLTYTNTVTFLTTYLPDLFLSASMIFMSGYQRNFGAQTEDPRMSLSWAAVYAEQKKNAAIEEARKKSQGPDWGANAPAPIAVQRRS